MQEEPRSLRPLRSQTEFGVQQREITAKGTATATALERRRRFANGKVTWISCSRPGTSSADGGIYGIYGISRCVSDNASALPRRVRCRSSLSSLPSVTGVEAASTVLQSYPGPPAPCPPPQCTRPLLAISHMAAIIAQHAGVGACIRPLPPHWRIPPLCTSPSQPSSILARQGQTDQPGSLAACCRAREQESQPASQPASTTAALGRALSSTPRHRLGVPFSSFLPPQNLAIKTPSPRPQLHRKRNSSGLAWQRHLRVTSTSDGYQSFATSLHALWRNPARERRRKCLQ
jgi:hypothetical protein